MYRLLIVDDEAGHRAGLLGLLCLLKPDYLVFEAENAQRALQMMDVMALDLVITDIRMPGMDGLAFLSLARRKQPHARFTILSAYGTFEYAKQGIALGADDYLLKPVDVEELRDCLDRMEGRLREARTMRQEQAKIQDSLLNLQSNYVEQQMHRFVMGELPAQEAAGIRQVFGRKSSGILLYLMPECGWRDEETCADVRYLLRERLKPHGSAVIFRPITDDTALAGILACDGVQVRAAEEIVGAVCREVEALSDQRLIAGVCCLADAFFDRLSALYHRARGACLRHFFAPERRIAFARLDVPFDPYQVAGLELPLGEIAQSIKRADARGAYALFEAPLRALSQNESVYPSKVKEIVTYAFVFIAGSADMRLGADVRGRLMERLDTAVLESRSFVQMLEGLRGILDALCDAFSIDSAQPGAMNEAVRYVQAHFCEELTLASVAQRFHYNPSYFSLQFKQAAGASFSNYLCELRMREAAGLLRETDLYAATIGARVGYPNAAYFTKAFKRRYGLSPDQYRKRGGRE